MKKIWKRQHQATLDYGDTLCQIELWSAAASAALQKGVRWTLPGPSTCTRSPDHTCKEMSFRCTYGGLGHYNNLVSWLPINHVQFPTSTGININMMPFVLGDKSSLPTKFQVYYDLIEKCEEIAYDMKYINKESLRNYLQNKPDSDYFNYLRKKL